MNRVSIRILRHRAVSLVMALCLMLSLCPVFTVPAHADSTTALDKLVNWGVVRGYPDGGLHPERNLTRAEFVAMVNRAYGYKNTGATPFTDVASGAWYADDIGIAYNAHYFNGVSPRRAAPESTLTREQAMVLLARNMRLDPIAGEVTEFRDGRDFSQWGRGYARAAAETGLITGYDDGTYRPNNNITRGEMAYMLQRALGTLVNTPGTHTLSDVYGNVTINTPGATLKNSTVAGNLYITGGLDLGEITLDNVRVLGKVIVAGSGESQRGTDSVVLRNVEANSLLVDSIADQFVTLRAEGDTEIRNTELRSDSYIQDRTRPGQGLLNISLESPDPAASFTLSGNLENIINKTPGSTLNLAVGTADTVTIDEAAYGSKLNLDINSTASTLNLDIATDVSGVGDVDHLYVNAAGSKVEMLPDIITIRPGLTANIAGQDMDVIQAQESSAEPRLLAGYPRVKGVAPTSASAIFSANKAGKVYWAVSATANGSVDEENLINPIADNTKAIANGTTDIAASNKETTAALSRLTADGSYYLSAVMVDARNRRSPVKVVAFDTPDNTTPAFNSGYPVISRNYIEQIKDANGKEIIDSYTKRPKIDFRAQVSAMANKGCQIYYALYPAGSTAPTAQQFRVGSLGTTVPGGSGVEEVTRNSLWTKTFYGLEELKSYDLYLCLIDADGSRSSAVRKLTFTAKDGTPPEFQFETPEFTNIAATSLRLRVNLSENGTFYWVALKSGIDYLKVPAGGYVDEDTIRSDLKKTYPNITEAEITEAIEKAKDDAKKLCEAYYKRQIENGIGAPRSGSQTVRAGMDTNVNITGLTAESSYDIYFVAKDTAGNYSDITLVYEDYTYKMTSNKMTESTLDVTGPTVTQEFTSLDGDKPLPNTSIRLTFSENIRLGDAKDTDTETLQDYLRGSTYSKTDLANFLSRIITLKSLNTRTNLYEPVLQRTAGNADTTDWVIDWSNAVVTRPTDGNSIIVTLPTNSDKASSALQLKSGATYRFEFDNLTDTSSARNPMPGIPYALPRFTTVTSQIGLMDADVSSVKVGGSDVSIDAAFMMTPVSTNVADSISWDMLIWSDRTVSFDLYQEVGANTWQKLGSTSITVDSSMAAGSFAAISLQRSIIGNVTEFPRLSTLTEPQYRYAVHITKLGTSDEADKDSWSGDVNLRISVVTGSLRGLSNLSANRVTEQVYNNALATSISANQITDIGSPRPFTLPITFRDTTSPKFANGYPRLVETTDSGVSILTRLDRPGTLYYMMVPADTTGSISKSSISTILETQAAPVPASVSSGSGTEVSIDETKDAGLSSPAWALGETTAAPNADQIHSARVYYSDDSYKVGTPMSAGAYNQSIQRSDLTADTRYFVYFVTRGEGGEYSKVSVYTFKTPKAAPPMITVYQGTSTSNVDVQVNAESLLTYIVVPYNTAVNDQLLSQDVGRPEDNTNTTILNALIDTTSGRSKFDTLATESQKTLVARYISNTQAAASSNSIASALNVSVSPSKPLNVDPSANMVGSTRYVFLTVGRRTLSADDGNVSNYAFAAYSPLLKSDTTPPMIISVNDGGLSWDKTASTDETPNYVSGKISLSFGEDLYWYNSTQSQKKVVDLAARIKTTGATETRDDTEYVSVESLVQGSQGSTSVMRVTPVNAKDAGFEHMKDWYDTYVNQPTQVIEIYVSNARVGSSITFTARVLGDANNNVSMVPLVVSIGTRTVDNQREPWVTITSSWNGTGDTTRSMR